MGQICNIWECLGTTVLTSGLFFHYLANQQKEKEIFAVP